MFPCITYIKNLDSSDFILIFSFIFIRGKFLTQIFFFLKVQLFVLLIKTNQGLTLVYNYMYPLNMSQKMNSVFKV